MKNIKYIIGVFISSLLLFTNCQEDDVIAGELVTPSNIEISLTYMDEGEVSEAPGLGSGKVILSASADNAISYHFIIQDQKLLQKSGNVSHVFTTLGTNTYAVTVIAYGTGGISSSKTIEVEVLASYSPPADLIEMLTANSSRTFRIDFDKPNYFGLGPVGTTRLGEWWPNGGTPDKSNTGMYDDRYTFNIDGTFTHDTGIDGDVFGRQNLINEIGGPGDGTPDGADILAYSYGDYTENWTLTAPNGQETLTLSGFGFIGYYIGGNHSYRILERSANSFSLISTDGNNEFDWNFILIAE